LTQTASPLDQEPTFSRVRAAILAGDTNATIAAAFNTSEKSVRRFRVRHGLNPSAVTDGGAFTEYKEDGTAEAGTAPSPVLDDPDTMLRQRGLDPEEWVISGLRANEYQGPASADHQEKTGESRITYYQTRFSVVPKQPIVPELQIMAPRTDGWIAPKKTRKSGPNTTVLVVVVGDQQAPFHDPGLHRVFLDWLRVNRPDEGVSLGDSVDFPDIRPGHRFDPENNAVVNECLQSGYDMFRGYVDASPDTYWQKLIGNHDERLRNILLDSNKARPLYGIKRPVDELGGGESLLSLSHAMRLDELGVQVVDPKGQYDLAQIKLSDKVAVKHGWLAQKGAGASALATLRHLGYSVIVGHTHRQSIVHETKHEIGGNIRVLKAVETGCMCRVDQTPGEDGRIWPNYAVAPDWQQGFATVALHPNGTFQVDLATYVNGSLLWRDQLYTA
jgi:hypothetical protein